MKRLLTFIFAVGIPLTAFHYYKKYNEDSQYAVKFYVYSHEVANPIDLYTRNIPPEYRRFFKAERVKPFTGALALYRVNNDITGNPDIHYLLHDKRRNEIRFLKSRFLIREKPESADEDAMDSYLIDYAQFSRYIPDSLDTEEIITEFASMLCEDGSPGKFRRVRSTADIDSIKNLNQKEFYRCSQPVLTDIGFINEVSDGEFLFWYFDKGIVKFTAHKKNGEITSISSRRLGFGSAITGM
jgi:hypothetical protein